MPKRIQRKRIKGWRMPEGTVNVTRPGKWANPFRIGGWFEMGRGGWLWVEAAEGYQTAEYTRISDSQMAVDWYRRLKTQRPHDFSELRGKDLACWCPLGSPCHADVLLELANA